MVYVVVGTLSGGCGVWELRLVGAGRKPLVVGGVGSGGKKDT